MKNLIFILLVPFLLCFGRYAVGQVEPEEEVIITKPTEDSADINTFYDELSKDGDWIKVDKDEIDNEENLEMSETVDIDDDIIDGYVWRPRISYVYVNWNPYTYGHWVFTRFGWVWVSDYEWGWAPYHYGRWWFSVRWGWVWSPGHRWAPNWVSWCHTRHHIGWHPISPRTRWRHHHGIIITRPVTPRQKSITNKWTFVKNEDFNKKVTNEIVIDLKNNKNIVSDAKITSSGDEVYNTGPKKKNIEQVTGTKITTRKVSVVDINKESSKNNNQSKTKSTDGNNNVTNKKNNEVNKNTDIDNTRNRQTNKNTENGNRKENTTNNPNTNRESNKNTNTNRESNKNTNTNRESNKNKNTNRESNKNTNTNRESNKNTNTNKGSNNNTNKQKETYKAPTYNPGNSNKNSNTNKETYKAPTYNPGNSNKNSNTNKDTYKAPTYNPGNSNKNSNSNHNTNSKPNNSPKNNPGNSNKNSSPPPKKGNS